MAPSPELAVTAKVRHEEVVMQIDDEPALGWTLEGKTG